MSSLSTSPVKYISTFTLYWQFLSSNLVFLLTGKLRLKQGDLPSAGHHIPIDFCGVGVAASSDPAYPAYLIGQLNILNIKQVRLDFTYGDFETDTGKLLNVLIAENFNVWLHIVQPYAAASRMDTSAEQASWVGFVGQVVNAYAGKISVIEIGSTINRARWAGYNLAGFFAAWRIAHGIIKSRGVMLAGPNITDFEPIYNIGFLSLMAKYDVLPDIHTDNLFAERSTEPERFDHKIAGRKLAPYLRYNLVKKSHLLQKIAQQYQLKTVSPSAFWTLPRIARVLLNAEQKQADYLTRYLVLTAASGLKSAFWGPFICHREGLIDEGDFEYPKLERITHYANLRVEVANYQARPAFEALKTFQALVPNSQYLGRLNNSQDLEVHAFKRDADIVHVAWTINGHVAKLSDCYDENRLENVTIVSQTGIQLSPQLITESPIYLLFKEAVSIKKTADVMPKLVMNNNTHQQYFWMEDANWQGMMLAENQQQAVLLFECLHPNKLEIPNKLGALRHARNAIWTIANPFNMHKKIVVKKPVRMHWHKQILDKNKPSKARRSWNGACELLRRGIETAQPIGFIEARNHDGKQNSLFDNYYFCDFVAGDLSVRDVFSAFAQDDFSIIAKQNLFSPLVDYVQKMHNRGVFFRDLSGGNVLINKVNITFSLIDTARLYAYNYPLSMAARLSDLSRLCNKLKPAQRDEFMLLYCKKIGRDFGFMQKIPFIIYDVKVAVKRQFRTIRRALR